MEENEEILRLLDEDTKLIITPFIEDHFPRFIFQDRSLLDGGAFPDVSPLNVPS
jgi:hypothetical protein